MPSILPGGRLGIASRRRPTRSPGDVGPRPPLGWCRPATATGAHHAQPPAADRSSSSPSGTMSRPPARRSAAPRAARARPHPARRRKASPNGPRPSRHCASSTRGSSTRARSQCSTRSKATATRSGTDRRSREVVLELTDAGLDYYFLRPLELADAGFLVRQSASLGMIGAKNMLSPILRDVVGRMDGYQLKIIAGFVRQLMGDLRCPSRREVRRGCGRPSGRRRPARACRSA